MTIKLGHNENVKVELIPEVLKVFQGCKNIDELWVVLHEKLLPYGTTSIFYGLSHSLKMAKNEGIGNAIWKMSSHPEEYSDYFGEKYFITHDLTALHCLEETTPFIWHDRSQWGEPTEEQLNFMIDSFEFNMGVGVTLPIRFRQYGFGGIGLCAGKSTEEEFDEIWAENKYVMMAICYLFDELARVNHMKGFYSLTDRELEVLTWLTLGKPAKKMASELGISASTIEKHIRSGRKKLEARNNEQAITKAIVYGLIHP